MDGGGNLCIRLHIPLRLEKNSQRSAACKGAYFTWWRKQSRLLKRCFFYQRMKRWRCALTFALIKHQVHKSGNRFISSEGHTHTHTHSLGVGQVTGAYSIWFVSTGRFNQETGAKCASLHDGNDTPGTTQCPAGSCQGVQRRPHRNKLRCSSLRWYVMPINLLKPSGYFTYHQV